MRRGRFASGAPCRLGRSCYWLTLLRNRTPTTDETDPVACSPPRRSLDLVHDARPGSVFARGVGGNPDQPQSALPTLDDVNAREFRVTASAADQVARGAPRRTGG